MIKQFYLNNRLDTTTLGQSELGVIAIKRYSIFPKVLGLESHHQSYIQDSCLGRGLTPHQRCSQHIL